MPVGKGEAVAGEARNCWRAGGGRRIGVTPSGGWERRSTVWCLSVDDDCRGVGE